MNLMIHKNYTTGLNKIIELIEHQKNQCEYYELGMGQNHTTKIYAKYRKASLKYM